MSASGLQRRKIAGGINSNNSSSSIEGNISTNLERSLSNESGVRVAVDPNDMPDELDKKQPKLTLMEEVLLLGLKDKQGYLSFWNDNISYTLRGCILMELAFRGRIAMIKDPARRKFPLSDRYIEVVDEKLTGEYAGIGVDDNDENNDPNSFKNELISQIVTFSSLCNKMHSLGLIQRTKDVLENTLCEQIESRVVDTCRNTFDKSMLRRTTKWLYS
ncbi:9008_t:CDS:2, partial [Entrophospora sp. SA101]